MSFVKQGIQSRNNIWFEYVFNRVCVSINLTRSDVGVSDQIEFPQSMLTCQSGGFLCSSCCQANLLVCPFYKPGSLGSSDCPQETSA